MRLLVPSHYDDLLLARLHELLEATALRNLLSEITKMLSLQIVQLHVFVADIAVGRLDVALVGERTRVRHRNLVDVGPVPLVM